MTLPSVSPTGKRVVGVGSAVMSAGAALLYCASYVDPYTALATGVASLVVGGTTLLCGTRYVIRGRIRLANGQDHAGVLVTLSGSAAATATTGVGATFSFNVTAGGNYVVTPTLAHHVFTPASRPFNNLRSDQDAPFRSDRGNYAIHGQVTRDGNPLDGVRMTISGNSRQHANTNAGAYHIPLPAFGNYTVTPTLAQYTFAPASRSIVSLTQDQALDFVATLVTYRIHGRFTLDGGGVDGIQVHLNGDQEAEVATAGGGYYEFNVSALGSYTVSGRRTRYDYDRRNAAVDGITADTQVDFIATVRTFTLRCELKLSGQPLGGVPVRIAGGGIDSNLPTDADGARQQVVPAGEDYRVTLASPHHTFAPDQADVRAIDRNKTVTIQATLLRHTISGRVTGVAAAGLDGIKVRCSVFSKTREVTTAGGGLFTFSNVPSGHDGRVRVNDGHFDSNPADVAIAGIAADRNNVNFVLTRRTFTISGALTINGAAPAATPVDLFLNGVLVATVNSGLGGAFDFGARPSDGAYTVKPRRTATLTFHPFREVIDDLLVNHVTAVFAGTRIHHGNRLTTPAGDLILSFEARSNIAGQRGADHAIPLDVLADAAGRALGSPSNDRRGGYYFPITGTDVFLAFILNADSGHTLFTCYEKTRRGVETDIGRTGAVFDAWVAGRYHLRQFTGGEDL
ncbi:hypothetical protein [Pseudomonas batumici]|uniref:Outer membrane protein n=1 Tax=Pseudomonas batumici TaxID=226910 RepID=A0A0C2IEP9_9PSED|nr:hypothetical protein [Pseudomonas batumici]KIH83437.1 Outer membrane protein [Pseudomonas batumici]